MKITIDYDSCWRNSFLGGSNNEALPKKGREFLGSMTKLKKEGNFKVRENTLDTVMGLLNRLIGDQRKLYQARSKMYEGSYYFEELESKITFVDKPQLTNEMTFIRNMNGSTDQSSFSGMIKESDSIFTSEYSPIFWGVLSLDVSTLCNFIVDDNVKVEGSIQLDPLSIINRLELLNKEKPQNNEGAVAKAIEFIEKTFPESKKVKTIVLYCSALYLQLARLEAQYDMSSAKTKISGIRDISKRGFINLYKTFSGMINSGMIKESDPIFTSEYSPIFWGVLSMDISTLCNFIVDDNVKVEGSIQLDPLSIINRLELINKEKPQKNEGAVAKAIEFIEKTFPESKEVTTISLYCSALYLQLARLEAQYDMSSAKTKTGGISGISKLGFTKKDFMGRYTTGPKKTIWGNPFIKKEKIKGQGEVKSMMTKASGQLEIIIDVDRDKGQEIKKLIENAGVSSFYLGKKGLAYVSNIRV